MKPAVNRIKLQNTSHVKLCNNEEIFKVSTVLQCLDFETEKLFFYQKYYIQITCLINYIPDIKKTKQKKKQITSTFHFILVWQSGLYRENLNFKFHPLVFLEYV